ncbi:MAG TPA: HAD-IC family P-type ATPase, partial [Candidatus Limnocylindria bacterium]|nr:HAD-IC family P-type ATPase [Candidatus Limnocylindria bacterium]
SEHPLASAIVRRATDDGLDIEDVAVTDFAAVPGGGVRAVVDGQRVTVGSLAWVGGDQAESPERIAGWIPERLVPAASQAEEAGQTVAWVAEDGVVTGLLTIADRLKPEAAEAVSRLRSAGLDAWLLTGDRDAVAQTVAAAVGVPPERVVAEVRPDQKAARVAALQGAGRRVAMVGDGINDAPALAQADLGIAIGTGADVAVEASDLTLIGEDVRSVATSIGLARATMRIIRQNLIWAFGYNVALIPIAAGILYPFTGWTLNPALAAGAMALSSVSVVTNSLRLRRFRGTHD